MTARLLRWWAGLDFGASQFNRATQSRRQPGSAFKPFIYAAAIDNGYTPASLVNDAPIVFDDPSQERTWKPMNFSERFFGPTRLREAMIHSRNLISVRIVMDLGVQPTIDYVTDFGFQRSQIPNGPSMALGSASITPSTWPRPTRCSPTAASISILFSSTPSSMTRVANSRCCRDRWPVASAAITTAVSTAPAQRPARAPGRKPWAAWRAKPPASSTWVWQRRPKTIHPKMQKAGTSDSRR